MPETTEKTQDRAQEHLVEYRKFLVAAEQKSQEDFDKTVLTLSGGALAISFTFLKEVVGTNDIYQPVFLVSAWWLWAASIFCVLLSYFLSHLSLRKAIQQVDDGTIYSQRPGGRCAIWTASLNIVGAVFFVFGVCALTYFASVNFSIKGDKGDRQKASTTTSTATAAAAAAAAPPIPTPRSGSEGRYNGGLHTTLPTARASP